MKKYVFASALAFALAACSQQTETPIDTNEDVQQIEEVKVTILTPEHVAVKETVKLEVKLTQGEDIVNDADDVKFEVWQSGMREQGQMLEGTFVGEGIFTADTTFETEGVYYMFAHTNARGMHIMPKQQITVGEPDMSTVLPDDSSSMMEHHEDEQKSH